MTRVLADKFLQTTLSPQPGIRVRYMKIPHIVDRILSLTLDPDYKKMAPIPLGPGDFKISFLSDDELKMVNEFKAQKKQIEWL